MDSLKKCTQCGTSLPLTAYGNHSRDGRRSACKRCLTVSKRERRQTLRWALDVYKRSRGCQDCGTRTGVLDLDHLPGFDKVANVSKLIAYDSVAKLEIELAKCEVVCKPCHGRRGHIRRQFASI